MSVKAFEPQKENTYQALLAGQDFHSREVDRFNALYHHKTDISSTKLHGHGSGPYFYWS